ncbi:MAG: Stf0 family sulfotransferase [Gaiellaceae bacterium]
MTLPTDSYLICASPRSGSGLLAGVLRSSGIAGRPEEYFWRGDMPHWQEVWGVRTETEYLRAALDAGSTPNGVFGARVMWAYLDDVVELATRATGAQPPAIQAAFPHLHLVALRRLDHVAQAVSWAKAEQTGVWYEGDSRGRQRPASFDADLIQRLVGAIQEAERGWSTFASEVRADTMQLTYEDVAADPIGAGRLVLDFLGLPSSGVQLRVRTRQQADATNEAWIARYRAEHR